jgi:hypothetical protein
MNEEHTTTTEDDAPRPVPFAADLSRIPGYEMQAVLGHGALE